MSDTVDTSNVPETAAADPASASSPVAPSPPADTAAGDDPFGDLTPDQALFPRGYVEKLRSEGARYRTEASEVRSRLQRYDDVFGVYPESDQEEWFKLAQSWARDPNEAAEVMRGIADAVLNPDGSVDEAKVDKVIDEVAESTQLTPEAIQQMISEALDGRDQASAEAAMVEQIYGEIRAAGYDPETREGFMVLWTANNETDGDIPAAIEKIKGYKQSIIDDYVAGRATGQHATPAPTNGVAANQATEMSSWDDARKATEAFLRGQQAAGT